MTAGFARAVRVLGWAGVVPFALLALVALTGAPGWLERLLLGYAIAILAFTSGSLWGGLITAGGDADVGGLILSNALVLAALPAILLPLPAACALLAVLFVVAAAAERHWLRARLPARYKGLRLALTASAAGLLVLTAALAYG